MRRRFVQLDGVLHEVTADFSGTPRGVRGDTTLWNDRAYQDMGDQRFKSRSQHREYMKRNNLTTVDDMHGVWKANEKKRIDVRAGIDPSRKHHIADAIKKLSNGG